MSMTAAQFVERAFTQISGGQGPPELRDAINNILTDCLQALAETVSDSPLAHLLKQDFNVVCSGGVCSLDTVTLVGGGTLASGNIYHILFDTIPSGYALHPDSNMPIQWVRNGNSAWLSKPDPYSQHQVIRGILSGNQIVLAWDDTITPSNQTIVFKASYAPLISWFSVASADREKLEADLVALCPRLLGLSQPSAPQGAPQG